MSDDRTGNKTQESVKTVLDILNLVLALKDAYMDIRRSLNSDRKVSRRLNKCDQICLPFWKQIKTQGVWATLSRLGLTTNVVISSLIYLLTRWISRNRD